MAGWRLSEVGAKLTPLAFVSWSDVGELHLGQIFSFYENYIFLECETAVWNFFFFSFMFKVDHDLRRPLYLLLYAQRDFSPEVKRPGHESNKSPPSSAKVMNEHN